MKAFNGFKSEAMANKPRQLPAGPYVAKIKAVKIDGDEPDQQLVLRVDVIEGDFANYFSERYKRESEKFDNVRYKGDYKIRIPNENNKRALYPESDIRNFNDAMYRIEQSNPGYHWDWNEQGLAGLVVGINMQESEYNGSTFTRIGRLEIADDVRKAIVKPMAPKKPKEAPVDQQTGMAQVQEELPCDDKPAKNPYF